MEKIIEVWNKMPFCGRRLEDSAQYVVVPLDNSMRSKDYWGVKQGRFVADDQRIQHNTLSSHLTTLWGVKATNNTDLFSVSYSKLVRGPLLLHSAGLHELHTFTPHAPVYSKENHGKINWSYIADFKVRDGQELTWWKEYHFGMATGALRLLP